MNKLGRELKKVEKTPKYSYILRLADTKEQLDNPDQHILVKLKKKPTVDQLKVLFDLYDKPYIRLDTNIYESELYTLAEAWGY